MRQENEVQYFHHINVIYTLTYGKTKLERLAKVLLDETVYSRIKGLKAQDDKVHGILHLTIFLVNLICLLIRSICCCMSLLQLSTCLGLLDGY